MIRENVRWSATNKELHEAMGLKLYMEPVMREIDPVNAVAWACVVAWRASVRRGIW